MKMKELRELIDKKISSGEIGSKETIAASMRRYFGCDETSTFGSCLQEGLEDVYWRGFHAALKAIEDIQSGN